VAELLKAASRVEGPAKIEIECGRLRVNGSDFTAEYFKFESATSAFNAETEGAGNRPKKASR
jgi:hypothetical protein